MNPAAPAPEEMLRRIALALGHPPGEIVTFGALEGRVDTWVRAMAMIARHVAAADARDPMKVAQAVEDRIAGRPIPPKAPVPVPGMPTGVPVPVPLPAGAHAAPAAATPATPDGVRAFVREGHVYVELAGVRMRVTGVQPSP